MKNTIFVLSLSLLLTFVFAMKPLPVYAGHEDFAGDDSDFESFDEPFFDDGDIEDEEETFGLDPILEDLSDLHADLLSELEDFRSKPLKNAVNKIGKCVDLLEKAISSSEDGEVELCGRQLTRSNKLLDKAVNIIDARQCPEDVTSRRCIPSDIGDLYLEDLEDLLDNLDEELSMDDDEDGIPDVCGFSEDFEEEF